MRVAAYDPTDRFHTDSAAFLYAGRYDQINDRLDGFAEEDSVWPVPKALEPA